MDERKRGLFQHPEDDQGPRTPKLIRGIPVPTVIAAITMMTEVLAAELEIQIPGGMVMVHELVPAQPQGNLRCWQFQFGKDDGHQIMECSEDCVATISNFLDGDGKISSVQFGLEPGAISDPAKCKLVLAAQGFDDPRANESLVLALASYFQWIEQELVDQIARLSGNHLTEKLLSSKFLSP